MTLDRGDNEAKKIQLIKGGRTEKGKLGGKKKKKETSIKKGKNKR